MNWRVAAFLAAVVLHVSRTVHADTSGSNLVALELDGRCGWIDGRHSGGVAVGTTGRVRYAVLTAGLSLQGATILFGSMGSTSGVGGLSIPLGFIRLDALAEFGINGYTGVGSNFLNGDPGTNAILSFAGTRTAVLVRVLRTRQGENVWLGPQIQYAKDLDSITRTYTFIRDDSFGPLAATISRPSGSHTVNIGQSSWSYLLVVGVTMPI